MIGVGSSFLELTDWLTKGEVYVGDYSRKTTELGPTSAAVSLLRALQWLRFIPSERPRPDGSLHSLTSVAALVSDLIS